MTGQSIAKKPRPIVFSLAELQKYPTLEDRYAITLPFANPAGHCYCTYWTDECVDCELRYSEVKAKCIKRTGERWAWFTAARDIDDERGERLGTLGYLPWEIRQEIMKAIVLLDSLEYPGSGAIREVYPERKNSPFMFAGHRTNSHSMQLASPSTRVEFEHYYLTKTTFMFDEPRHLEAFLDKLSIYKQSLLRSFSLKLFPPGMRDGSLNDWVAVCARLPPNLMSIQFEICPLVGIALGARGEWFICDDSWGYENQPGIDNLDILGKRARRCAARAKIGLWTCGSDPRYEDINNGHWVRVLHELEPWSGDWLKWWEEATKTDSDDGEGAIDIA